MSKKGNPKNDDEYTTDSDDDDVLTPQIRSRTSSDTGGSNSSADRSANGAVSSEFKLKIETSSSSSSSDSESDGDIGVKLTEITDNKRRRSDPRAQGKSHDLERKARGEKYLDKSPPRKKHMSKVSLETKLYQGQRELTRKEKHKENKKKEKQLVKEQRKLDREREKLEKLKKQTAEQAAREANQHWKVNPSKKVNRVPKKLKKEASSDDDSDDSSVQVVGHTPVGSKAAARIISAKAGTFKTEAKYKPEPDKVESKGKGGSVISGGKFLDEIKKDTLNQARAVKRHQTKNTKDVMKRLDHQDTMLRGILNRSATHLPTGPDPAPFGAPDPGSTRSGVIVPSNMEQLISRIGAQDSLINDTSITSNKIYSRTKKIHDDVVGIQKTVDEILNIVKKCPHKGDGGGSNPPPPPPPAATPTSVSVTSAPSAPINPSVNVTHSHQYFQHSHSGPTTEGSGTQIHHSSTIVAPAPLLKNGTPRVDNPYPPKTGFYKPGAGAHCKLTEKGKRLAPTYVGPINPNSNSSFGERGNTGGYNGGSNHNGNNGGGGGNNSGGGGGSNSGFSNFHQV